MNIVIGDLLRQSVIKYPARKAVISRETAFTYSEFNTRVNRLANGILSMGLKKGDRLGILLMNCSQFLELIMACAKAGVVMVPVNWRFQSEEIRYVLDNAGATALIMGEEFIPVMEKTAPVLPLIPNDRYVVVGERKFTPEGGLYEGLLAAGSPEEPAVEISADDVFVLAYTSGTTGFPKGAVIPHRAIVEIAIAVNLEYEVAGEQVNLIVMPTFHVNSIWNTVISFLTGATIYIYHLRGFDGAEILKIIHDYRVTMSSMVPTMYFLILAQPEELKSGCDVSCVRMLLSSSAPISFDLKKQIMEYFKNARLFEGYGSTETGMVTSLRPEDQIRKPGSIGRAVFGKQVKVLDAAGKEPPPGEIGEIYTRGINIFREYYRNPDATKAAFTGDWCTVGDMGYCDEEGYFYLVDRKNDMIISGGENIYPTEVENAIMQHPAVQFVAVVGVPDDVWGESVKAVVTLRPGMQATGDELMAFAKERLAGYKRPRSVDFVEQLPMTPTGKILRRLVKEPYWKEKATRII